MAWPRLTKSKCFAIPERAAVELSLRVYLPAWLIDFSGLSNIHTELVPQSDSRSEQYSGVHRCKLCTPLMHRGRQIVAHACMHACAVRHVAS